MTLTNTPVCDFGAAAPDFDLPGVDGKKHSLASVSGPRGTLVMFICNHCPYVIAVQQRLLRAASALTAAGVGVVAINPNDADAYPEDSMENMVRVAAEIGYPFPYLYDQSQTVARAYGAVCTPDFFGYNADLELQYRGRLDATSPASPAPDGAADDLIDAMSGIAASGTGPQQQIPSMGCSIKWR